MTTHTFDGLLTRNWEVKETRRDNWSVTCQYEHDGEWFTSTIHEGHSEAIARLIASAPALLGMCRSLVQCLESHLSDEAKRIGCTLDELCPCKGHELKQARELIASLSR